MKNCLNSKQPSGDRYTVLLDGEMCPCYKELTDPVKLQAVGSFGFADRGKDRAFLFLSQKLLLFLFFESYV